jgi:hypothetical protein
MDTENFVLDQNISHYRKQLKSEADLAKRKILAKLLADANAELAQLLTTPATRDFETAGQQLRKICTYWDAGVCRRY